jgi:hypothetical protein
MGFLCYVITVCALPDTKISEFYVIFHYKSIASTLQDVCIGINKD